MSQSSATAPSDIHERLRRHQQEHVLHGWDKLPDSQRRQLLEQLADIDLDHLAELFARKGSVFQLPAPEQIHPVPVIPVNSPDNDAMRRQGEEALRQRQVAVLIVAGGQGSRLGFEHPKGMYPVGPVSHKSLFEIHVEKVRALGRRYAPLPLLIMTSPATHAETEEYFAQQSYFGLPCEEVFFFCQGTMPGLDLATGKLLLEQPGRLFLSPDGHGGMVKALARSGLLDRLRQRGIRQLFYFQVDNPLVKVADPVFLGHHLARQAQVSSKIVPKKGPEDKLGNLVVVDGRCTMIEYSDLPPELGRQTDEHGRLRLWAGSPAIHYFDLDFLAGVAAQADSLPFHLARKKVPCINEQGQMIQPERENALKFERFIFDLLPLADRWTVVETTYEDEFAPLKNAQGADSPQEVARAQSELAARWLIQAGVKVPRRPDGALVFPLEISSLFALDAEELARRLPAAARVDRPTYWHE
jgi:UDP-N-acetylglucosamine/UDP-N-acetylgalactosamine diphosphorylase